MRREDFVPRLSDPTQPGSFLRVEDFAVRIRSPAVVKDGENIAGQKMYLARRQTQSFKRVKRTSELFSPGIHVRVTFAIL
jgi:hypothetical protein